MRSINGFLFIIVNNDVITANNHKDSEILST
jgi:hypothetical protein